MASVSYVGGHTSNISRLANALAPKSTVMVASTSTRIKDAFSTPSLDQAPAFLPVQMTQPSDDEGIPKPVIIGGVVVGVLALGLVAFKLTHRKRG